MCNKGQRGGDTDSYFKSLGNALVSSGLLTDDNCQGVEFAPVTSSRDPKSWGSRITLEEMEAKQCER
jgi:hypothetical protein